MDAQTLRRALADFFQFNQKDFSVQSSPTGYLISVNRVNTIFAPPFRLQVTITDSEPPTVGIRYGEVNQEPADAGMNVSNAPLAELVVSNGDTAVFVVIPCVWDTSWAFWKRTGDAMYVASGATLPAGTANFAYCRIANIVVAGDKVTTCSPSVTGDQTWSRLPAPTIFVDDFTAR